MKYIEIGLALWATKTVEIYEWHNYGERFVVYEIFMVFTFI